ncbi:vitamin K epoxide reductase family protein [Bacteroides oleiciplenus]|uniref:vitamin K epoxide reductase family protein n=1 Tax=Bacteroides oleiciplenus TaxID=626931 RepID=UPI0026DB9C8E|nr:vitamin K epoxide reductase family protein [Bacteroides oleiciplenus]
MIDKFASTSKPQNVFTAFLASMEIEYTDRFSNKYFNEHPHKYSLFGLSKMLADFKIENVALRLKDKEKGLSKLEVPFIAYVASEFAVVKKITPQQVQMRWKEEDINTPIGEFFNAWTGVVLLANPDENSEEPELKKHRTIDRIQTSKKTLLFFAAILLCVLAYVNNSTFTSLGINILLLLNIIGAYTSYLLLMKQMKVQSKYADKICTLFKEGDCNSILETDAAKLWGTISWSEIGLGYFIANSIILLSFPQYLTYLSLTNICALPYTLWSLYYQKFKAKQWCPLCLIVQAIIWIIFFVSTGFNAIYIPSLNILDISIIAGIYLSLILIINLLVENLSKSLNIEQVKQEINSIKSTNEVFVALLKKQPNYEVSKETSQILYGNTDAKNLITVLTNPHCNPCAMMHKRIIKLLASNHNFCVQYIFSAFDESLEYSNHFLISAYINKHSEWEAIVDAWFEYGKYDKENFFKSYGISIAQEALDEAERHNEWKLKNNLMSTPTVLINGYKLPNNYMIEDLVYFTDLVVDTK